MKSQRVVNYDRSGSYLKSSPDQDTARIYVTLLNLTWWPLWKTIKLCSLISTLRVLIITILGGTCFKVAGTKNGVNTEQKISRGYLGNGPIVFLRETDKTRLLFFCFPNFLSHGRISRWTLLLIVFASFCHKKMKSSAINHLEIQFSPESIKYISSNLWPVLFREKGDSDTADMSKTEHPKTHINTYKWKNFNFCLGVGCPSHDVT